MLIQIIDVAIGLMVVYLIFSTVASSIVELVALMIKRRARMLFRGIEEIFRSAQSLGGAAQTDTDRIRRLAVAFYQLVPIASLYIGAVRAVVDESKGEGKVEVKVEGEGGQLPAYIPAKRFAGAVLGVVKGLIGVPPVQTVAAAGNAPATPVSDDAAAAAAGETGVSAAGTTPAVSAPPASVDAALIAPDDFKTQCERILTVAALIYAADKPASELSDEAKLEALEQYFNDNTDRITSWYRRHVHAWLLLIGILLASLLNVDTLQIVKVLSQDSAVRERIVAEALGDIRGNRSIAYQVDCSSQDDAAGAPAEPAATDSGSDRADATTPALVPDDAQKQEKELDRCEQQLREGISRRLGYAEGLGLPLGWSNEDLPLDDWHALLLKILGWLLTALAICVGAPFWFDLLNRLANVRAVLKPEEDDKNTR